MSDELTKNIIRDYSGTVKGCSETGRYKMRLSAVSSRASIFHGLGTYYYIKEKYDLSLKYFRESALIREKIDEKKGQASALNNIGNIFYLQGRFYDAVNLFRRSIDIYSRLGNLKEMSDCFSNLGIMYSVNEKNDSAMYYFRKALAIDEKHNNAEGISACYSNIGLLYSDRGNYDSAFFYLYKSVDIDQKSGNKKRISSTYNNLGNIHFHQGNYDKAVELYLKSLKIIEESGNTKNISSCYINLGNVHSLQKNYKKSLEYYRQGVKTAKLLNDNMLLSICYLNIGVVNLETENYDTAIYYCKESLIIKESLRDKRGMSKCYNNLGNIYKYLGSYDTAIDYYKKSEKIFEEMNFKDGLAAVYGNLASIHNDLSDSMKGSVAKEHLKLAQKYGLKSLSLGKEINSLPWQNLASRVLMKTYRQQGNLRKALDYADNFIVTKDSMFSEEKTKSLAEAEKKFEAEKKQLLIEKLKKEKDLQDQTIARKEAESKKQRVLIISFMAGFILILVFSVFIYRLFLLKKKANIIISEKNRSLETAYSEISVQKEEIETQRDEIEAQRDRLDEQNIILIWQKKEITDSIAYAKRIQNALMPDFNKILTNNNFFILFKPKDIVSGDFYWAAKINEWLIVTVADCTGHGVPGAFMSMLGISFLNEIVRKKEVTNAADILNYLRSSIIDALKQIVQEGSQKDMSSPVSPASAFKDGMDIALCVLNTENLELQYAGANNAVFIVSSNEYTGIKSQLKVTDMGFEQSIRYLYELKADKQPVGIHSRMKPFTNNEVQLSKGDTIYLFSDGYQDQFGGPCNRKFMAKKFKELVAEISFLPLVDQKEILTVNIEEWKGMHEQVDDITIVGIKTNK